MQESISAQGVIVIAFVSFLVIGGGLLATSVRRGRDLCDELARRLPERYEELGLPLPALFDTSRWSAYTLLVMQRRYANLDDPFLVEQFDALRKFEVAQLVFVLAGFGALGLAAIWYEFIRAAP